MLSFPVGYEKIRQLAQPLECESSALDEAFGRVLREDLIAKRPHPALDISAMDGYALCGACAQYRLVGEVAAGKQFAATLVEGDAVRIFTGAALPDGADRVLIQENAKRDGATIIPAPCPSPGEHIRKMGADFSEEFSLKAPLRLKPADLALIGAMNYGAVLVTRQPRLAILATGSELVLPGQARAPLDVIASNAYGIKALAESFGAKADIHPIVPDDCEAITKALLGLENYDLVVTTGGASVGDYDFVESAAKAAGFDIALHKIALRPGKPIMAGTRGAQVFLGLPGNPVSSMVCAVIIMRALIFGQLGIDNQFPLLKDAQLTHPIQKNGDRTHFMRAQIAQERGGFLATPVSNQDSAAISLLAQTNALLVIEPNAPAKAAGEWVQFAEFGN